MMTLHSMTMHEGSQYLGKMKMFGVLVNLYEPMIDRLCFLVRALKIHEACVISIMDPISIFELMGDEYLDAAPECHELVVKVGWLGFLQKFSGFNLAILRAFTTLFDGLKEQVEDIVLQLMEEFISWAIGFPMVGEHWYKGKHVKNDDWKDFLTPTNREMKYKSSFPSRLLKKKWCSLLELIIRYVTCEGRISQTQFYHLRLLMVFKGSPVNMPYYFLNSLHKMACAYQSNVGDKE